MAGSQSGSSSRRMTPSEALVETLVAQGVRDVFGIVGSAYMDALDLFQAAGIRFVPTVHEQGAAHMADGYARVSGRHGVCIAQNGPGVTNFVTAVAAAYWAHTPVVMITPETGSTTMGLGGFQETDQLPIFSKITKFQAHVSGPQRMAELAARCFDRAMLEMGPTQLNIPRDHFYGEADYDIAAPIRIERGAGGEQSLEAAAALLAGAWATLAPPSTHPPLATLPAAPVPAGWWNSSSTRSGSSAWRARPKSTSTALPSSLNNTFSGLRLWWMTFWRCRSCTAAATAAVSRTTSSAASGARATASVRLPPPMRSMTSQGAPSTRPPATRRGTCGPASRPRTICSTSKPARQPGRLPEARRGIFMMSGKGGGSSPMASTAWSRAMPPSCSGSTMRKPPTSAPGGSGPSPIRP